MRSFVARLDWNTLARLRILGAPVIPVIPGDVIPGETSYPETSYPEYPPGMTSLSRVHTSVDSICLSNRCVAVFFILCGAR